MDFSLYEPIRANAWDYPGYCADNAADICITALEHGDASRVQCLVAYACDSPFGNISYSPRMMNDLSCSSILTTITAPDTGIWTPNSEYVYHFVPVLDGMVVDVQLGRDVGGCIVALDDYIEMMSSRNPNTGLSFDIIDFQDCDFK